MSRIVLHDNNKIEKINPETMKILDRYKIDMVMRNLSAITQHHYELDLLQWFTFVLDYQQNRCVTELTDEEITEFLYYCTKGGNHAARIKLRISTISAFYRFMRKKRIIRENPIEFIDRPKTGPKITKQTYLSPEQVAVMRERLIERDNLQLRLYAMLSLSTMARASAIARIKWDQIDFESKVIHGVLEKEGKIVDLFFSDEVKCLLTQLKQHREEKGLNDYGYVLHSARTHDKPVSTCTLNAWCKQIGKMIGVYSLHPHDFRHSGATLLKNSGMSLEDISVLLSHESTDTTKKYYIKEDTNRIAGMKSVYNI